MARAAARFERVEWIYDGLNGKIIPWTKANGGTSDDPSALVFAAGQDGRVLEKCPDATAHQPKAFVEWLGKQAAAWERAHPRTKVPFRDAELAAEGEGAARKVSCPALDEARGRKAPAALYVGREEPAGADAKGRAEAAAARKFEKEALGSGEAAKAAEGWTLLRVDRGDPDGAALARALGVEQAPAVLLFLPGEEKPVVLGRDATGGALALQMKKAAPR